MWGPAAGNSGGTSVECRGFGWTHAGRRGPALEGIDLRVEPGERLLIAGDSGSGKSTLLAALAGVLGGPDEGTQHGTITVEHGGRRDEPGRSIPVGLVLQDPDAQVIAARVRDDVAFGCENLGIPRAQMWPRVEAALEMVGLDLPRDYPTAQLSGGQKQRLALAGVIAMGAGLILLDEPTANLDPQGARDVVAAVAAVVERTAATLIVVEHNCALWEGVLDRAVVLERGQMLADAPVAEVIAARQVTGLPRARAVEVPAAPGKAALWSQDLLTRFGPPRTATLPAGASTVITGDNGAGKTTWLMTVAGLLPARGGTIGVSAAVRQGLAGEPHAWRSADLARRIGVVFQNPEHQFVARSVRAELELSVAAVGAAAVAGEGGIDTLMERLRLSHLAEANPFTLSGGEKRRLSVATALVAAPPVLLLDEPTFGQDPHTYAELVHLLRELADSGVAVASITHDPLFIGALGDHRVHFAAGGAR